MKPENIIDLNSIFSNIFTSDTDYFLITDIDNKKNKQKRFHCLKIKRDMLELTEQSPRNKTVFELIYEDGSILVNGTKKDNSFRLDFASRLSKLMNIFQNSGGSLLEKKISIKTNQNISPDKQNNIQEELDKLQRNFIDTHIKKLSPEEIKQFTGGLSIQFIMAQQSNISQIQASAKKALTQEDMMPLQTGSLLIDNKIITLEEAKELIRPENSRKIQANILDALKTALQAINTNDNTLKYKLGDDGSVKRKPWWLLGLFKVGVGNAISPENLKSTIEPALKELILQVKANTPGAEKELLEQLESLNTLAITSPDIFKSVQSVLSSQEVKQIVSYLLDSIEPGSDPASTAILARTMQYSDINIEGQLRSKTFDLIRSGELGLPAYLTSHISESDRESFLAGNIDDVLHRMHSNARSDIRMRLNNPRIFDADLSLADLSFDRSDIRTSFNPGHLSSTFSNPGLLRDINFTLGDYSTGIYKPIQAPSLNFSILSNSVLNPKKEIGSIPEKVRAARTFKNNSSKVFGFRSSALKHLDTDVDKYLLSKPTNIKEEVAGLVDLLNSLDQFRDLRPNERQESVKQLFSSVEDRVCELLKNLNENYSGEFINKFLLATKNKIMFNSTINQETANRVIRLLDLQVFETTWKSSPDILNLEQTKKDLPRMFLHTQLKNSAGEIVFSGNDPLSKQSDLLFKMMELTEGSEKADSLRSNFRSEEIDDNAFVQRFLTKLGTDPREQTLNPKLYKLLKAFNQEISENTSQDVLFPMQHITLPHGIGMNRDTSLITVTITEDGHANIHMGQRHSFNTSSPDPLATLDLETTVRIPLQDDAIPAYSIHILKATDRSLSEIGGDSIRHQFRKILTLKNYDPRKLTVARTWSTNTRQLLRRSSQEFRALHQSVTEYLESSIDSPTKELGDLLKLNDELRLFKTIKPEENVTEINELERNLIAQMDKLSNKIVQNLTSVTAQHILEGIPANRGLALTKLCLASGNPEAFVSKMIDLSITLSNPVDSFSYLKNLREAVRTLKLDLADTETPVLNDLEIKTQNKIDLLLEKEFSSFKSELSTRPAQITELILRDISNNKGLSTLNLLKTSDVEASSLIAANLAMALSENSSDAEAIASSKREQATAIKIFIKSSLRNRDINLSTALKSLKAIFGSSRSYNMHAADLLEIYGDIEGLGEDYNHFTDAFNEAIDQLDASTIKVRLDVLVRSFYTETIDDFSPKNAVKIFNDSITFRNFIKKLVKAPFFEMHLQKEITDYNATNSTGFTLSEVRDDNDKMDKVLTFIFSDEQRAAPYLELIADKSGPMIPIQSLNARLREQGDIHLGLMVKTADKYSAKMADKWESLDEDLSKLKKQIQDAESNPATDPVELSKLKEQKRELQAYVNLIDPSKATIQTTFSAINYDMIKNISVWAKLIPSARKSAIETYISTTCTDPSFPNIAKMFLAETLLETVQDFETSHKGRSAILQGRRFQKGPEQPYTIIQGTYGERYELLNTISEEEATRLQIPQSWRTLSDKGIKVIIGQGAVGKVRLARNQRTGELSAVKKIAMEYDQEKMIADIHREIMLQKEASSSKFVDRIDDIALAESSPSKGSLPQIDIFMPIIHGQSGDKYLLTMNTIQASAFDSVTQGKSINGSDIISVLKDRGVIDENGKLTRLFSENEEHPSFHTILNATGLDGDKETELEAMNKEVISILRQIRSQRNPEQTIKINNIAKQLLSAIGEIHDKGIYHRDIKSENFIIDTDGNIKIIDFGCASKEILSDDQDTGSPAFLSPEIRDTERVKPYDVAKADAWAVGITLYQMAKGIIPNDIEDFDTSGIEAPLKTVIDKLLNANPDERITIRDAIELFSI
jgi:serine/threonine protein kinase